MSRASVLIGIGGEGKVVLMKIRKLMVEEYGSLQILPHVRFLHLDTCTLKKAEPGQNFDTGVLGEDISFDEGVERVELSENLSAESVNNPKVKEWFPENLPTNCNFKEGAGGVRSFGRLAFQYNVNKFLNSFNNAVRKATEARTDGIDIYIVCSLFGGTGSGAFLDVCYNVREELRRMQRTYKLLGSFIIGAEGPNIGMQSNCYAALKEMEYFNTTWILTTLKTRGNGELAEYFEETTGKYKPFEARYPVSGAMDIVSELPPVDNCYLFGSVNCEEKPFDRDSLESHIARRIFFEIMPGIGETIRAKRIDIEQNTAYYIPDRLQNRAKCFFTTGVSVIEYPAPRIMNALACGLSAYCCHYAPFPRAAGFSDLKKEVEKFIDEMGLTEGQLKRSLEKEDTGIVTDSIRNGIQDWKREIEKVIDNDPFDEDNIEQKIRKIKDDAEIKIREGQNIQSSGIYVQIIKNNGEALWRKIEEKIKELLAAYVSDKEKGAEKTEGLISALIDRFKNEASTYEKMKEVSQIRLEEAKREVERAIRNMRDDISANYRWELRRHTRMLCEEKLGAFVNMGKERSFYGAAHDVIRKTEQKLVGFKDQVKRYKEHLKSWSEMYLTDMLELIANLNRQVEKDPVTEGLKEILQQIPHDPRLIWEKGIGEVYREFINLLFRSYGNNHIINPISNLNDEAEQIIKKASGGDLFNTVTSRHVSFKKNLFAACRERFKAIERVNICDLLLNIDQSDLKQILREKKKESGWILKVYTHDETIDHVPDLFEKKWVGVHEGVDITTHQIWKHLSEYNEANARFKSLKEPYRMLFINEMGVFCLRNIELLKSYKEAYDKYPGELHTNKQITFPDIMPPNPKINEVQKRAEGATLLGAMFGFLKKENDPIDHYPSIFLYYSDHSTKVRKSEKLCKKWKEVEETMKEYQIKKEVDKSILDMTPLEKLEAEISITARNARSKEEKEAIYSKTEDYLKDRLNNLHDEKHPFYQRDLNIIEGFRKSYGLSPRE